MDITVVILASNFENMNYDCSKLAKKKKMLQAGLQQVKIFSVISSF